MEAIMVGLAAYGTIIPFGGTFFNFVSYASGAVRLAALSKFRTLTVATHDSIGLGEDGPTHQPIETIAHFRAVPNLMVWRPADGNETSAAYYVALVSSETPSILCLTRQNLPQLAGSSIENAIRGGYVLLDIDRPNITLASSGSEVSICVEAAELLKREGINSRVVSLPCWETFMEQEKGYRLKVLPDGHPIMYVEPYSTLGTEKMAHESFGINGWGASMSKGGGD
jgi:transketolase